ncbi:DUF4214 domain-containing protein [Methylobacterium sp. SyP6R]|uniref:DUF4214 domain-containing protein n=1 Tax=Methylobacterium sp. SyP6R TaxID=2718876 RepID=UPI001F266406|nr:DUF4214 domain-containing protein [Methylobacterium sp. SyP6R]MCF4130220.1 DUF4214 domain-containing protein [Methylobacterium sp. SyP6R]MCF4130221.1 DUF4214 domain-containing protein [Methylobacterium sp. SyP6R]
MSAPTTWSTLANALSSNTSAPAIANQAMWNLQSGTGTVGIDATGAWKQATGAGVSIAVFDDNGQHATAVTGLLNAKPSAAAPIGVAYDATLSSFQVVGVSASKVATTMANAVNFDVANNSWGWDASLYVNRAQASWSAFFADLSNAADHGRGGLGTTQVVAAGNGRATGGDTNLSNFTNDRHMVTVAAVTSEGKAASYSNGGASVLVAAPSSGGARALTTTDLAGAAGYSAGDTTDQFGGTSAAAPQVSGVAALMLQANPNLGWRDVKTILAYAAEQPAGIATTTNGADHWNGGGLKFSNDTGYGVVDARTAVRLAETWGGQNTSANELNLSVAAAQAKTLTAGSSISYTFTVGQAINVETAEITLQGTHSKVGDLTVQLISPDGTVSTLLDHDGGSAAFQSFTFSSNAFLSEGGAGQWTLKVSEGAGAATGNFTGATLALHGADAGLSDDIFVFTDAYGSLGSGRDVIHANSGHAVINAAATTSNDVIDLHAGATSTIAGHAMTLSADSTVKTAYAGDGHVTLIANDLGNTLVGGHGITTFVGGKASDVFVSGSGNSIVTGGGGQDRLVESGNYGDWNFVKQGDGSWQLIRADGKMDLVSGVSQVQFNDKTVVLDVQGNASAAALLYGAAFDRAPDAGGLVNWTNVLDTGSSLKWVAQQFVDSQEFVQNYGASTSNTTFVHELYENALHRAPDAQGLANWTNALDHGVLDRAEVLIGFAQSLENLNNHSAAFQHGLILA